MTRIAHRNRTHSMVPGKRNRPLHRPVRHHLAKPVTAIKRRNRTEPAIEHRRRPTIHRTRPQPRGIPEKPHHTMRLMTPEISLNQRVGHKLRSPLLNPQCPVTLSRKPAQHIMPNWLSHQTSPQVTNRRPKRRPSQHSRHRVQIKMKSRNDQPESAGKENQTAPGKKKGEMRSPLEPLRSVEKGRKALFCWPQ